MVGARTHASYLVLPGQTKARTCVARQVGSHPCYTRHKVRVVAIPYSVLLYRQQPNFMARLQYATPRVPACVHGVCKRPLSRRRAVRTQPLPSATHPCCFNVCPTQRTQVQQLSSMLGAWHVYIASAPAYKVRPSTYRPTKPPSPVRFPPQCTYKPAHS